MKNSIFTLFRSLKELPAKYPAVISGYIIYLYLFIAMLRFFIVAKTTTLGFFDVIEMFDALPFMWLLALVLVKVIQINKKLHQSETKRIVNEQELQIKETQIDTMREMVMGLQHQVNNPLAIMMLTIHKIKRTVSLSPELSVHINSIDGELKRISQVLKDFSNTQSYEAIKIGKTMGSMAIPEKQG